jgi:hypothetical protein
MRRPCHTAKKPRPAWPIARLIYIRTAIHICRTRSGCHYAANICIDKSPHIHFLISEDTELYIRLEPQATIDFEHGRIRI